MRRARDAVHDERMGGGAKQLSSARVSSMRLSQLRRAWRWGPGVDCAERGSHSSLVVGRSVVESASYRSSEGRSRARAEEMGYQVTSVMGSSS